MQRTIADIKIKQPKNKSDITFHFLAVLLVCPLLFVSKNFFRIRFETKSDYVAELIGADIVYN